MNKNRKNEKKDIIRENKVLPFRYELECEDAMPTMQATARAKVTRQLYFSEEIMIFQAPEQTSSSQIQVLSAEL